MLFIKSTFVFLYYFLSSQAKLTIEIISLRHQLGLAMKSNKRPKLTNQDRILMIIISKLHSAWQAFTVLVQPATVIYWHRYLFKKYWRWKSKKIGRPTIDPELIAKIKQLSKDNPRWSPERIRDTLALHGFPCVSKTTVRKYMLKTKSPNKPSGNWKTFLHNHRAESWGVDFFTVYTLTFNVLYCFVVLDHGRRKVIHVAVTANPSLSWILQQLRNSMPFGFQPRFLFRDNDKKYGYGLKRFLESCEITDVPTAYKSPWQNPYVERFIGTLRRDLLDHVIVINERHLYSLLKEYINNYYHIARPHQGLDGETPDNNAKPEQTDISSKLISFPVCGGLHHRYEIAA